VAKGATCFSMSLTLNAWPSSRGDDDWRRPAGGAPMPRSGARATLAPLTSEVLLGRSSEFLRIFSLLIFQKFKI
jgi:hypothetical protein